VDYSHPVFEPFGAPRSGDVTDARFFRYRPIEPGETGLVLARFDDSRPALVERRVGLGRVLVWTSTLDNFWGDFALKPVFLPFVHTVVLYLADYRTPTPWFTAGQVLDLAQQGLVPTEALRASGDLVVLTPDGERVPVSGGDRPGLLELSQQGFYEVRRASQADARLETIAVNLDLSEADLSTGDPQELAAAVTGRADVERVAASTVRELPPEELERQQAFWWYLLAGALALFVAETVVGNRLSRTVLD